jgi:hypothetical protein
MQTLVLVIADRFVRGDRPLSTAAGSLVPALEGMLVIAVVCVTVMSAVLPPSASIGPLGVGAIGIVVIWVTGIVALNRTRTRSDLALVGADGGGNAGPLASGSAAPATSASAGSDGGGRPILRPTRDQHRHHWGAPGPLHPRVRGYVRRQRELSSSH